MYSWGLRFAGDSALGHHQRSDLVQAYRSGTLYVLKFLEAYLKDGPKALAFQQNSRLTNGIAPQIMSMKYQPAPAKVVGEADFLRAFAASGYQDAQTIYTNMKTASAEFTLSPPGLNTLGYQLPRGKNARAAVELFKLATYLAPEYGNAFDSEGEAHEALGDTAAAIAAYEKAVAVDKRQTNAIARIKALRRKLMEAAANVSQQPAMMRLLIAGWWRMMAVNPVALIRTARLLERALGCPAAGECYLPGTGATGDLFNLALGMGMMVCPLSACFLYATIRSFFRQ